MIKEVTSQVLIETTAKLAHKIWNQHYLPIIGQDQVDYMLDKFQDVEAITDQIKKGYEYFIIYNQNEPCGYLALVPDPSEQKMMISKIYVDANYRGKNLGSQLLDFSIEVAKNRGYKSLWLTVNKYNSKSIYWYKNKGFEIKKEIKIDIGNGFIMDDYLIEMTLDY